MTIDFKQYLPQLKELQELDRRIRQIEFDLVLIPEQLHTSGADYLTIAHSLKEKEGQCEAMTEERLNLETAVKETTAKVLDREKRVYAIKTQKEYQATLKEIAQMKQDNKARDERILVLLAGTEKINEEITQLKSQITDKESGYRQIEGELKKKQGDLETERSSISERRPALLEELPAEILKKYDFIRRSYPDPVAGVKREICQGCNMNIPPQLYNEMLRVMDLRNCPNCHRLIYVVVEEKKTK
ncbi:MAG: C4-type zinc ribbon domain-containing protein [Deltaproteobacteria bacterium]|nr:C4-type zinc ribbon domain-containing protein [Deltaproteobacteria bacterium]